METTLLNLCNLPPWAIASRHFNRHPKPIEIQGVRHAHRFLFERLSNIGDPVERGRAFHDYMDVLFQLHQWQREGTPTSRKSLKNSYLSFLKGWMFDSNGREGAVLKGWVESRLGIPPTFHREPIDDIHSQAYYAYSSDRMRGSARTSAILQQLDLLFTYVQEELPRHHPQKTHLTLWRGVNYFDEHRIVEDFGEKRFILRLNNLNSFTTDFERAWEFGSRVLQADIPLAKIFFHGNLLPNSLLKGEGEVVVIGGETEIKVLTGG